MSFDFAALDAAIAAHGAVVRVVIAAHAGSAPRAAGTSMLIWGTGSAGTIGGGALEWEATARARAMLAGGGAEIRHVPLGPSLGQCCGGAVTLVSEVYDAETIAQIAPTGGCFARRISGGDAMPLGVTRHLKQARADGRSGAPALVDGWLVEALVQAPRALWIYGAGHVGRAIVAVLAPLPDFAITWVDTAPARFPDDIPANVTRLVAANPADVVSYAPKDAAHLVLSFSHALDLELCHQLLGHGFGRAGLIGSKTKWARFRARLGALGHLPAVIQRIECPIGDPALGKHPQAIAVGVATALLKPKLAQAKDQMHTERGIA